MKRVVMFLLLCMCLGMMCSCEDAVDPEEIITVNYNAAVEEAVVQLPFSYQLSESMKEKGFLSIEKRDDGVAVYTIKRQDYETFITELATSKKEIFDGYNTEFAPYVTSVSYNEDLTEITVAVDRTDYETVEYDYDSAYRQIQHCIGGCKSNVTLYHCFSTDEFKTCKIQVMDHETNDILKTIVCPDMP